MKSPSNPFAIRSDARRDLYLVQRDHARARYDYLLNKLRLHQAAGSLSVNDLVEINSLLR